MLGNSQRLLGMASEWEGSGEDIIIGAVAHMYNPSTLGG